MKITFPLSHILHQTLKTLTFSNPYTSSPFSHVPHRLHMAPPDPHRISIRSHHRHHRLKDTKIVVVMGATGSGKSRLSIDLATHFFPSFEIINCDKIQLYKGLDITTNKIPIHERKGHVHHLLGKFETELSPSDFRSVAAKQINDVVSRRKVPLLVGGSNTYIHALLSERYDPHYSSVDPFSDYTLRYNCCFLWVDVSISVLNEYLVKRVDDMLKSGMFEELETYFTTAASRSQNGINRAIGVPEFEPYFRKYPCRTDDGVEENVDVARERIECYAKAVETIKENTCQLAKKQIEKIQRLKKMGWDLKRLDATAAFRDVMNGAETGAWERDVVEPSVKVVKRFLADE